MVGVGVGGGIWFPTPVAGEGGGGGGVDVTVRGNGSGTNDSVLGVSAGPPDPDRVLFASVLSVNVGNDITALTIGGVSASLLHRCAGGAARSSIWVADVPTGTSVDVVGDVSNLSIRAVLYSAVCAEAAAAIAASATFDDGPGPADPINLSLAGNGNLLVVGGCQNGSAVSLSGVDATDWSGDALSNEWFAFGHALGVSGTVTPSMSGHGVAAACAVATSFALTAP